MNLLFLVPQWMKKISHKIFDGLNDKYKELVFFVQARDIPITFDEL